MYALEIYSSLSRRSFSLGFKTYHESLLWLIRTPSENIRAKNELKVCQKWSVLRMPWPNFRYIRELYFEVQSFSNDVRSSSFTGATRLDRCGNVLLELIRIIKMNLPGGFFKESHDRPMTVPCPVKNGQKPGIIRRIISGLFNTKNGR